MSKFALLSLLAVSALSMNGCATPAYSPKERGDMIARNWDLEGKQIQDDVDHILLLRPAGNLTIWNVRGGY